MYSSGTTNPMMRRTRPGILLGFKVACAGGLAFWTPDTVIHAIYRDSFDSVGVLIITVVMPLTLLASLFVCARRFRMTAGAAAIRMLAGVWLPGGAFMALGASFSGGGFFSFDGFRVGLGLIAMSLLPPVTFMMAAYDGSLGALLLVTLILLCVRAVGLVRSLQSKVAKTR
jgi:hypothetical protein